MGQEEVDDEDWAAEVDDEDWARIGFLEEDEDWGRRWMRRASPSFWIFFGRESVVVFWSKAILVANEFRAGVSSVSRLLSGFSRMGMFNSVSSKYHFVRGSGRSVGPFESCPVSDVTRGRFIK